MQQRGLAEIEVSRDRAQHELDLKGPYVPHRHIRAGLDVPRPEVVVAMRGGRLFLRSHVRHVHMLDESGQTHAALGSLRTVIQRLEKLLCECPGRITRPILSYCVRQFAAALHALDGSVLVQHVFAIPQIPGVGLLVDVSCLFLTSLSHRSSSTGPVPQTCCSRR